MNGLVPALHWRESLAERGWTIYRPRQVSFVLPTPAPGPPPASMAQVQGGHCPVKAWVPAPASPTWTESMSRKSSKGRETMQVKVEEREVGGGGKARQSVLAAGGCPYPTGTGTVPNVQTHSGVALHLLCLPIKHKPGSCQTRFQQTSRKGPQ